MNAASDKAFTLFVESGLHAGTVQRLKPGVYTLGSELEADVILSDKQIESVHLIVELDRRGLRLEPLQGAISIDGESVDLEPGGERHLTFPAAFSIGDTSVRVTAPQDAVQTRQRVRMAAVAAGIVLIAVVGMQVVGPLAGDGEGGPTVAPMDKLEPHAGLSGREADMARKSVAHGSDEGERAAAEKPATPETDVTLDQAAAALRERLASEKLADIDVRIAGDRIAVQGEAEPERMADWQGIRMWFDGAFGQDFLMVANVEAAEKVTPPKLAIEAVWSGDDPYLVAGGRRFFVGAPIGEGWKIARIGSDEIIFKRGDKSFSLAL